MYCMPNWRMYQLSLRKPSLSMWIEFNSFRRKVCQRIVNYDFWSMVLLPLWRESMLPPRDQVEFQMPWRCLRAEKYWHLWKWLPIMLFQHTFQNWQCHSILSVKPLLNTHQKCTEPSKLLKKLSRIKWSATSRSTQSKQPSVCSNGNKTSWWKLIS